MKLAQLVHTKNANLMHQRWSRAWVAGSLRWWSLIEQTQLFRTGGYDLALRSYAIAQIYEIPDEIQPGGPPGNLKRGNLQIWASELDFDNKAPFSNDTSWRQSSVSQNQPFWYPVLTERGTSLHLLPKDDEQASVLGLTKVKRQLYKKTLLWQAIEEWKWP